MKKALLPLILLVSLLLSIGLAARAPFGDNPDERGHRDYVRILIANGGPVKFTPFTDQEKSEMRQAPNLDDPPYDRSETHQPPLYYYLCIPVQRLSGGSVFGVRMVAAIIQLLTIFLAWRAIRNLFKDREDLALAVAAFVAFLPTQVRLSAAINNDCLATLVCVALFWRFGVIAARGQNVRCAILLGVVFGIGLWTKSTVLQLVPAMLVAYALAVRAKLLTPQLAVIRCATSLAIGIAIASPWLLRNQMLYGDPLALSIYRATGPNFTPQMIMQALGWSFADYARNVGTLSFATFWYMLPPSLLKPPPLLLLAVLVLALGGLLGAYGWASRTSESEAPASMRRSIGVFAVGAALLVPFFVQFVLTVFQAQGRYFLPGLLPIATVTMLGWGTLANARRPVIGQALVAVMLLGLSILQLK